MTNRPKTSGTPPTPANLAALAFVREKAVREHRRAIVRAQAALGAVSDVAELCAAVRRVGVVTLNFHPDRLLADGRSVAEALYEEGAYRNQFESGISNGGLAPFQGSFRDGWEKAMFGGAYHAAGVQNWERPKYGGLNLMNLSNGACPRFGSCHLRLTEAALDRCTFFFGDSAGSPNDGGVIDAFESVVAGLLESLARNPEALGRCDVTLPGFVDAALRAGSPDELLPPAQSHELDNYIETQVHGAVALHEDVAALVIDPSFAGAETGEVLIRAAERHDFPVEWNAGLTLTVADIPTEVPSGDPRRWRSFCAEGRAARLGARVAASYARDGKHLDAAAIGQAAASVVRHPSGWQEWGPTADALTCLKDLWLILVFYGKPASNPAD